MQMRHCSTNPFAQVIQQLGQFFLSSMLYFIVENLNPNAEYELRVVAKSSNGFGEPSEHVLIKLRSTSQQVPSDSKHQFDSGRLACVNKCVKATDYTAVISDVPSPPGKPLVVECDGMTAVRLVWEAPVSRGCGGPVIGYCVEYRPLPTLGSPVDWIVFTEKLVNENTCIGRRQMRTYPRIYRKSFSVSGLRPNGQYEFRISAKNSAGLSVPSSVSDMYTIRKFKDEAHYGVQPRKLCMLKHTFLCKCKTCADTFKIPLFS